MTSTRQGGAERGLLTFTVLGVVILGGGILRFILLHNFSLAQAAYCLLSIPVAVVVLMIFDYTLHHARIVAFMVVATVLLVALGSGAFCVGLGLAMLGMVVTKRP